MKQKINPNRMELLRLQQKIIMAQRGHKLLKDKLDGLVQNFLGLSKEYQSLLPPVENELSQVFTFSIIATGLLDKTVQDETLKTAKASLDVNVQQKNIMGVRVPLYSVSRSGDPMAYDKGSTPAELDETLFRFSDMLDRLVRLAQLNKTLELMASEIGEVRRRVNALEYVLIPELKSNERFIKMKLNELELSNRVTLFKIKDLVNQ
ncbi:MAG: V-type ATP synthase subunit D [Candidatus Margulisiibacteriota bacterium]|nr:V-type ATP synthase subunit D [Candidatus Margulisiibacteriota bacterium]